MKINGNFKVRNIYQSPYPREGQQYISEAFGKDLISMAIISFSTKMFNGDEEKTDTALSQSHINLPKNTYALIQRIMTCGKLIEVTEEEVLYIESAIRDSGYDNFIKGEVLTLMHDLTIDERGKPESKHKDKMEE